MMYYEVEFSKKESKDNELDYSVCIRADRNLSKAEATKFCQKNKISNAENFVSNIIPISSEYALAAFEADEIFDLKK